MKILQVIGAIAPAYGGSSTSSSGLNRALNQRSDSTSTIVSTDYGSPVDPSVRVTNSELEPDVDAVLFRGSWPVRLGNSWSFAFGLNRLARTADVLHIEGLYSIPIAYAYVVARIQRKPFGLQPHGNFDTYQRAQSRRKKRIFDALVTRPMLRRANYIVFGSDAEAEEAADLLPATLKPLICPLGVDLQLPTRPPSFRPGSVEVAECPGLVVYISRFASKKRVMDLVEAWALLDPAERTQLVLAGTADHWTIAEVQAAVAAAGLSQTVHVWDTVLGGEKTWLLDRALIFCLPSENENFGIVIGEAMLAGTAVLTTKEVAASDHVCRAAGGVVIENYSVQALVLELRKMLADPTATDEKGRRAAAYAANHMTWTSTADLLIEGIVSRTFLD